MYNLGEHFKIDYKQIQPCPTCILTGKKYRFTVLTDRLIRLEYNENGVFIDEPTQFAVNRNFPNVDFGLKEDDTHIEITTKYFKLNYTKDTKFNKTLKVKTSNDKTTWHYKHIEAKNYKAPIIIEDGKINDEKSLYSLDGFVSIDDSKDNILDSTGNIRTLNDNRIDIYLFVYLNDFDLALKDYFRLTGYPALIPRFALGNWWSKNEKYNDLQLKKLVDNFSENKIPISVILLDKDWHNRTYDKKTHLKTGFSFNKEYFKSPINMINYLHSKGIRIGLNINPTEGFYNIDDYYEQATNYLQPDENGVIPYNVLEPRWVDVYLKLYIHPLDAMEVDFYWLDFYNKNNLNQDYLLKYYQFNDMNRNYKRRPMVLSYNNGICGHRYPVIYLGPTEVSWDSLKLIPKFVDYTNLGISWWCYDIGGYNKGIEDNELYIRYVQLGTFSPIFKFGSDQGKYYKREPWRWNLKTLNIARDYLELRHDLIPYLYSEAYKYHKEGIPILKPIYYKNPEMYDDILYRNEYYFGSQLFISPIVNKKDIMTNRVVHRFFIPEGIWYDFFTGKKFIGNNNYVAFYKDQNYPVFAKAGSIIPLGKNQNINDTNPPTDMEIHFFPGVSNEYNLYEDDGISSLYKKDFYILTKIEYNYMPSNYTVIIRPLEGKSKIIPDYRNYKFIFRNVNKASDVIVYENNQKIDSKSYISGPNFVVEVNNINTLSQLTVNCKGKDIEFDATKLINEDIAGILDDLQIETLMKEKIDKVLFSDLPIKKKRIEIRKLGNKGLEKKFVKLFLKLLEYISLV